jgi:hypothetical protein
LAKIRLAAIFADIGFVSGGKKRGFCRLLGASLAAALFRTSASI